MAIDYVQWMNVQDAMQHGVILGLGVRAKFQPELEECVAVLKMDEVQEGEAVSQAEYKA